MSKLSTYDIEQRINSAYSMAKYASYTSTELNTRLKSDVFDELNSLTPSGTRRYTSYLRNFAQGYNRAMNNNLMYNQIEFCYLGEDGVLYSTHKNTTKHSTNEFYNSGRGKELSQLRGEFYWKHSDKPFTRSTLTE